MTAARAALLAALFLAVPAAASDAVLSGRAQVVDGDSLIIDGRQVRLDGIDAFEAAQRCERPGGVYGCGAAAKAFLAGLVENRLVACDVVGTDRYGRALGLCRQAETDLNAALVEAGWALAYRRYSNRYVGAEDSARQRRVGAWAGHFDTPERFRHAPRETR